MSEIRQAMKLKLKSVEDLIRLLVSRSPQGNMLYIYNFEDNGNYVYFVSQSVPGWFELRGLPVTMYTFGPEPKSDLIEYSAPSDNEAETWKFTEFIKAGHGKVFIPIIKIESKPEFLI